MDERAAPLLLLTPVLLVIAGYLVAWRGRNPKTRKVGNLIAAVILGLVALLGSWWALGMTIGVWALDGSSAGPRKAGEILLALIAEVFLFLFPSGAWYMCAKFAKSALRPVPPNSAGKVSD